MKNSQPVFFSCEEQQRERRPEDLVWEERSTCCYLWQKQLSYGCDGFPEARATGLLGADRRGSKLMARACKQVLTTSGKFTYDRYILPSKLWDVIVPHYWPDIENSERYIIWVSKCWILLLILFGPILELFIHSTAITEHSCSRLNSKHWG